MKNKSQIAQAFNLLFSRNDRTPGQLIIQFSDACNAKCPQCELRVSSKFKRVKIELDELKRIIDKAAANGVQALSFTGGEPFLFADELIEAIRYAGKAGIPYIRTGTNGFFLCGSDKPYWEKKVSELADKVADSPLYTLWFSLDSSDPQTHEQMRGLDGVVKGMEKGLSIFHERGIFPSANLGINRNTGGTNRSCFLADTNVEDFYETFYQSFNSFYRKVYDLGYTIVNACYPMSADTNNDNGLGNVYGAASSDDIVTFTRQEKALIFQAMFDALGEHRDKLRIFSPKTSLYMLINQYRQSLDIPGYQEYGYPCRGGIDYFFIDAQSRETWPCGFRSSETLGQYPDIDMSKIDTSIDCRRCDWECFRDPSELLGPALDIRKNKLNLFRKTLTDKTHYQLWKSDLAYYRACGFFNGREKTDFARIAKYHSAPDNTITSDTINQVKQELKHLYNQNKLAAVGS